MGLKPQIGYTRTQSNLPANFDIVVDTAVELRRECPTRSVNNLIKIMELENLIEKGSVSRSTLQRHLHSRGFGSAHIKTYTKKGAASRRFEKSHR